MLKDDIDAKNCMVLFQQCPSLIQWICTGELCGNILLVEYPMLKLVNYCSCLSSLYDIYTAQEHGHDYLLTEFEQMCCKVLLPSLTSTCLNNRVPLVYHSHWLGFTRKTLTTIAAQQGDELRDKFIAETPVFHLQIIVWVDEMGSDSQVAWLQLERNQSSEPRTFLELKERGWVSVVGSNISERGVIEDVLKILCKQLAQV